MFHPLNREQLRGIAAIQTQYLSSRLEDRDLELSFTEEALDLIAAEGFDPVYMGKLFEHGFQVAKSGYPWQKWPPGFETTDLQ